jgi:hypothetical protein
MGSHCVHNIIKKILLKLYKMVNRCHVSGKTCVRAYFLQRRKCLLFRATDLSQTKIIVFHIHYGWWVRKGGTEDSSLHKNAFQNQTLLHLAALPYKPNFPNDMLLWFLLFEHSPVISILVFLQGKSGARTTDSHGWGYKENTRAVRKAWAGRVALT